MAKRVPMYGVDLHTAKDHENIDLQLGVMASGIVVYLKDNKINSFPWYLSTSYAYTLYICVLYIIQCAYIV